MKEDEYIDVAQVVLKKYLREYEPVAHDSLTCNVYRLLDSCGTPMGRILIKTSEDIIRELEDIVELETNDVVAVMLAEGYDLMRRNEVYGWAMRVNGEH